MALTILEKQVQRIAIGCLYLFMRKAILDFPGSTNAAPSDYVTVSLATGDPLRGGDSVQFPFEVIWHLWERVVTPILQDRALWVRGPQAPKNNIELAYLGQWDVLVANIREALLAKMRDEGYSPQSEQEVEAAAEALLAEGYADPDGDGEPVVRNPAEPGDDVDGSLVWPEGHLRLSYPIVS